MSDPIFYRRYNIYIDYRKALRISDEFSSHEIYTVGDSRFLPNTPRDIFYTANLEKRTLDRSRYIRCFCGTAETLLPTGSLPLAAARNAARVASWTQQPNAAVLCGCVVTACSCSSANAAPTANLRSELLAETRSARASARSVASTLDRQLDRLMRSRYLINCFLIALSRSYMPSVHRS